MESNGTEESKFGFLNDGQVRRHFAELNNDLLRGKHIMPSSAAHFAILDEHEAGFAHYYAALYSLNLQRRTHDNVTYFYLEFPEVGKGRLSNPGLYFELDAKTTIVACILANLYFSNLFSFDKRFQWENIQYEIEHGEHRDAYQHLFFNETRTEFTDKEWENIKVKFNTVIRYFSRIGLVEDDLDDSGYFTILPTINHFIEIYKNEIEHIDEFLKDIKL